MPTKIDSTVVESIKKKINDTESHILSEDVVLNLNDRNKLKIEKLLFSFLDDMHLRINEVCKLIQNQFNQHRSKEAALKDIAQIREAKTIIQTENEFVKNFKMLAKVINLPHEAKSSICEVYFRLEFCLTLLRKENNCKLFF